MRKNERNALHVEHVVTWIVVLIAIWATVKILLEWHS